MNTATIEIINVDQNHPLDKPYIVTPDWKHVVNINQFANVGAILRDETGQVVRDQDMTITATDETQNKVEHGTGDMTANPDNLYYYGFRYLFTTAGDHVITFAALGVEASLTLSAE